MEKPENSSFLRWVENHQVQLLFKFAGFCRVAERHEGFQQTPGDIGHPVEFYKASFCASVVGFLVNFFEQKMILRLELVEQWIKRIPRNNLEYSYNRKDSDAFRLVGPYMPRWFVDVDSGEQRYGTPEDLALSTQVMDAYHAYGPEPIHVQTVRPELRQLVSFKTCLLNSREVGGFTLAADAFDAEYLCRLGQAAGHPPPYGAMEIPISPLKLNHHALDIIFQRRGRPDQFTGLVYGGGAVPMPGATAPIHLPAYLSQGLAEALAAYMTPKLIDERVQGYCSFGGFLFDMRTMNTGIFFPESLIYHGMVRQVIRFVLGETIGCSFRCAAFRSPGDVFRAGFDAALAALSGVRSFLGAGAGEGESFDPKVFVVDADIVRHVAKFTQGLPYLEDPKATLDVVAHGAESGMYLDHPSVLDYRSIYLDPELFFKCKDAAELMDTARAKVRQVLRDHHFALPDDRRREVEQVYAAAEREVEKRGNRG